VTDRRHEPGNERVGLNGQAKGVHPNVGEEAVQKLGQQERNYRDVAEKRPPESAPPHFRQRGSENIRGI
jgi:hypothetical protein